MEKEEIVIQFEILIWNLFGNTRKITKNITIVGLQTKVWRVSRTQNWVLPCGPDRSVVKCSFLKGICRVIW